MVNRVFCYSKEFAKQNGIKLPIWQLVLSAIMSIFAPMVVAFCMQDDIMYMLIVLVIFLTITTFLFFVLLSRVMTRQTGWATTNDGRIFKVKSPGTTGSDTTSAQSDTDQGVGGIDAGSIMEQIAETVEGSVGEVLGQAASAYGIFAIYNSMARYMSNPVNVARIIEKIPNIEGAQVFEILKVYSIKDSKRSVIINCDYRIISNGKIEYNKNIHIEKVYNQFDGLINAINSHRI